MSQRSDAEISRVLRERDHEVDYGGDATDSEEDEDYIEDQESSDTEVSCDEPDSSHSDNVPDSDDDLDEEEEERGQAPQRRKRRFAHGKDKFKWSLDTPEARGQRSRVHLPAAKGNSSNATNPYESWNALFSDEMLDLILKWTNAEIETYKTTHVFEAADSATFSSLTLNELKAYIGLLYYQGLNNNNRVLLENLWSDEFGTNLYKTVMSVKRFRFIGARLRFDDKTTRRERRASDLLAPIRELWDLFIGNCISNYTPCDNVTIDEQLLGFRGKFSARVYIKSKPARYGIKVLSLNDSRTFYMLNAIPYTGRVTPERAESIPTYFVRRLSEPIHGSGRVITCDNWFSSVECFQKMNDTYNLKMIGTLRKNKRQIPDTFKHTVSAGTMRVGYAGQLSLTSYCPKKNKIVLLLSSVHKSVKMDNDKSKPETILYYNKNKSGTDVFDQMCSNYSCARRTSRWPLRLFFGIIDQAGFNACILWNLLANHDVLNCSAFLAKLSLSLIKPHLNDRMQLTRLPKSTKSNIRIILGENVVVNNTLRPTKMDKRKRCAFCDSKKDKKTFVCCAKCRMPVCEEHRHELCFDCAQ
ncbi:piggyBac transposable element-derived protein 4-like [Temnothorax longispinosus]|uniref:piggyBac transposable element-derived protein 4-like n=1 Tax=Temnothorax longispinosus TaxID=300112 RepID=UPI003A98F6D9